MKEKREKLAKINQVHAKAFKPSGKCKKKVISEFKHMNDFEYKKINRKNKDGTVKIEPYNFVTNPPKSGNVSFTGF